MAQDHANVSASLPAYQQSPLRNAVTASQGLDATSKLAKDKMMQRKRSLPTLLGGDEESADLKGMSNYVTQRVMHLEEHLSKLPPTDSGDEMKMAKCNEVYDNTGIPPYRGYSIEDQLRMNPRTAPGAEDLTPRKQPSQPTLISPDMRTRASNPRPIPHVPEPASKDSYYFTPVSQPGVFMSTPLISELANQLTPIPAEYKGSVRLPQQMVCTQAAGHECGQESLETPLPPSAAAQGPIKDEASNVGSISLTPATDASGSAGGNTAVSSTAQKEMVQVPSAERALVGHTLFTTSPAAGEAPDAISGQENPTEEILSAARSGTSAFQLIPSETTHTPTLTLPEPAESAASNDVSAGDCSESTFTATAVQNPSQPFASPVCKAMTQGLPTPTTLCMVQPEVVQKHSSDIWNNSNINLLFDEEPLPPATDAFPQPSGDLTTEVVVHLDAKTTHQDSQGRQSSDGLLTSRSSNPIDSAEEELMNLRTEMEGAENALDDARKRHSWTENEMRRLTAELSHTRKLLDELHSREREKDRHISTLERKINIMQAAQKNHDDEIQNQFKARVQQAEAFQKVLLHVKEEEEQVANMCMAMCDTERFEKHAHQFNISTEGLQVATEKGRQALAVALSEAQDDVRSRESTPESEEASPDMAEVLFGPPTRRTPPMAVRPEVTFASVLMNSFKQPSPKTSYSSSSDEESLSEEVPEQVITSGAAHLSATAAHSIAACSSPSASSESDISSTSSGDKSSYVSTPNVYTENLPEDGEILVDEIIMRMKREQGDALRSPSPSEEELQVQRTSSRMQELLEERAHVWCALADGWGEQAELDSLKADVASKDNTILFLTAELKAAKRSRSVQNESLMERMSWLEDNHMRTLDEVYDAHEEELEALSVANQQLQENMGSAISSKDAAVAEAERFAEELKAANKKVVEAESEGALLSRMLRDEELKCQDLQRRNDRANAALEAAHVQGRSAKANSSSRSGKPGKNRSSSGTGREESVESLKGKLKKAEMSAREQEMLSDYLVHQNEKLKDETAAIMVKYKEAITPVQVRMFLRDEENTLSLQREITELVRDNEELQKQVKVAQSEKANVHANLQMVCGDHLDNLEHIEAMETRIEEYTETIHKLHMQIGDDDVTFVDMCKDIIELENICSDQKKLVAGLKDYVMYSVKAETELKEAKTRFSDAMGDLEELFLEVCRDKFDVEEKLHEEQANSKLKENKARHDIEEMEEMFLEICKDKLCLEEKCLALEDNVQDLNGYSISIAEAKRAVEDELEDLQDENRGLYMELTQKKDEIEEYQHSMLSSIAENLDTFELLEGLQLKQKEREDEFISMESECHRLKAENEENEEKSEHLLNDYMNLKDAHDALEHSNKQLQSHLDTQDAVPRCNLDSVKGQIFVLQHRILQLLVLESENSYLHGQVCTLTKDLEVANMRSHRHDAILESAISERNNLRSILDFLLQASKAGTASGESIQESIADLKKQVRELEDERGALKESLDTLNDEKRNTCNQNKELTKQRDEARMISTHAQERLHDVQARLQDAHAAVKWQMAINDVHLQNASIVENSLRKEMAASSETIKSLKSELVSMKMNYDRVQEVDGKRERDVKLLRKREEWFITALAEDARQIKDLETGHYESTESLTVQPLTVTTGIPPVHITAEDLLSDVNVTQSVQKGLLEAVQSGEQHKSEVEILKQQMEEMWSTLQGVAAKADSSAVGEVAQLRADKGLAVAEVYSLRRQVDALKNHGNSEKEVVLRQQYGTALLPSKLGSVAPDSPHSDAELLRAFQPYEESGVATVEGYTG